MYTSKRLDQVYKKAKEIHINENSKLILMSDTHRGNDSWSDNFAPNLNIYMAALHHYYQSGFTYIELGDGDDLWENRKFPEIRRTYKHLFDLLRHFYLENRLYFIYGNHDIVKKYPSFCKKNLYHYYDDIKETEEPLFPGITCHEGLILNYRGQAKLLLVHGNQGDLFNDKFWPVNRFLVRYFWRPLESYLGFRDLTSPAKNYTKKREIERKLTAWTKARKQILIAGHTHRPSFPEKEDCLYFNTGCGVFRSNITGLEIENGKITLVKWLIRVDKDNTLRVAKELVTAGKPLSDFFT